MTDQIKEQISALLDGELPQNELNLLVRRLERDPGLRLAFGRYALVGEVLRAPGGALASAGFAERVSLAVATGESAAASAPAAAPARHRRRATPMIGAAVAAGTIFAAVLLLVPEQGQQVQQAVTVEAPASVAADLEATGAASPTLARSQRMAAYLVAHGEYSTPIGRRNVWTGVLANDPGITRVSYEFSEAR
jgi:negative regulator of sigma E activity